MAEAQAEMKPVVRDAKNDQTNSHYARLEAIAEAITPIYTSHGFSLSYDQADSPRDGHLRFLCDVMHAQGHRETKKMDIPTDSAGIKGNVNKTPTHAFGSTASYGRRYLKLMAFDIATSDDDDGNAASQGELINEEQLDHLNALADDIGIDKIKFCKFFGIESLAHTRVENFDKAVAAMEAKRAKS